VLVIAHIAAASVVAPLDAPLALKAALMLLVAVSLGRSIYGHAFLKAKHSALAIEVKDQQTAAILGRDHVWRDARILGTSYVTPALTVLNVRVEGERLPRHVVLVPDNIQEQEFRRLRVLLRWRRPAADDTSGVNANPR
jgi:toxin CptA